MAELIDFPPSRRAPESKKKDLSYQYALEEDTRGHIRVCQVMCDSDGVPLIVSDPCTCSFESIDEAIDELNTMVYDLLNNPLILEKDDG